MIEFDSDEQRLKYAGARLSLGSLDTREIVELADRLLHRGVYHDELPDILDSKPPRYDEVKPPLQKLLRRLQFDFPDEEAAVLWLIDFHTKRIVDPQLDPIDCLKALIRDIPYSLTSWDRHGIRRLVFLNLHPDLFGYGETLSEVELTEYRAKISHEAKMWRTKFAAVNRGPTHSAD